VRVIPVGIESMNAFAGTASLDVRELARHRQLDLARFDNLLVREKTVALPCEDPVTFAVNAAKPLIDALSADEKDRVEMVITCTESSFDFGKSMSTYVHQVLGLNRNCRLFELKNACYSGTAGLQMAVNFILSQTSPGAKARVVATDISRFLMDEGGSAKHQDWSFAEPSGGAGSVAMLVSDRPDVFRIDAGANGYYGYEVMDTCRPMADSEAGDADLSLLSYLDCSEQSFLEYVKRVPEADYVRSFQYLAFHTPFGGMVKGAHRSLMRKLARAGSDAIEADFQRRVAPGLAYCVRVGNTMGAATMLSLVSTIDNGSFDAPARIGCFSYGSGCCSEFFSGVVTRQGQEKLRGMRFQDALDRRYAMSMPEYEEVLRGSGNLRFGTRNARPDPALGAAARRAHAEQTLFLREIEDFHREYEWTT
jgi:polyketide biosynthesis 3-hydroxy-3-methylglutaryl-CoA synthase-like enzyme PksG